MPTVAGERGRPAAAALPPGVARASELKHAGLPLRHGLTRVGAGLTVAPTTPGERREPSLETPP